MIWWRAGPAESPSQARDVQPEGGAGRRGRVHAPDRVDKLLGPDDLVRMQEQHRQKRAGLASGHHERAMLARTWSGPKIRNSMLRVLPDSPNAPCG